MKYIRFSVLIWGLLCLWACQNNTELETMLNDKIQSKEITSALISVKKNGRNVYEYYNGYSNFFKRISIDKKTMLYTGDLSRVLISLAMFKLIESDKLALDDQVSKLLDLKITPYYNKESKLTVRHLLTEVSTLNDIRPDYGETPFVHDSLNISELFGRKSKVKPEELWLNKPLPLTYHKADLNFYLLTKIITRLAQKPYQQYIEQDVLKDITTLSTFNRDAVPSSTNIIIPYQYNVQAGNLEELVVYEPRENEYSELFNSNYKSTKSRFHHFMTNIHGIEWVLKGIQPKHPSIVNSAHTKMLLSVQHSPKSTKYNIGLGTKIFRLENLDNTLLIGIADCYDNMGKMMLINPMFDYTIVAITVEPYLNQLTCNNQLSPLQLEILELIHQQYKDKLLNF